MTSQQRTPPQQDLSSLDQQQQPQPVQFQPRTVRKGGARPSEPRGPLPDEKFSLEYAVALWTQVENCDVKDRNEAAWLVESLRTAAELALWGDKNNHEVADYLIMESTIVSHIADVIDTPGLDNRIYVQCIQSVVILLQNHSRESTLFFILSNGKFNRIIEAKLDYSDEEIVSHFVSFLKTVTQRLQSKNILPLFCTGGSFPLLAAAMNSALLTHDDRMVRTSVRQVIAQLLRLKDDAVQQFAQGCVPRLLDDLGAFLEAQLRTLALYVTDESASVNFVEMTDEDILDEGLYLQDLLAGCTTNEDKGRMARNIKDFVLERLLAHAQDADSSDLVASTVVFLFLSKWLRNAPKWFLLTCAAPPATTTTTTTSVQRQEEEDGISSSVFLSALAWALLVPSATMCHHPASTVVRSAICCLGTLFHKLTDGKVEGCCCFLSDDDIDIDYNNNNNNNNCNNNQSMDDGDDDERTQIHRLLARLGQLVKNSLRDGFAKKVDRTSAYNIAAMTNLASVIFCGPVRTKQESEASFENEVLLRGFFDLVNRDSDLFTPEQSSLRLEVMMMMTVLASTENKTKNMKENMWFFPESSLNVFVRDQWSSFIDDLRFPLKRTLKFRSPISQQERLTHRASVITYLLERVNKLATVEGKRSDRTNTAPHDGESTMEIFSKKMLYPPSRTSMSQVVATAATTTPNEDAMSIHTKLSSSSQATISGTLVNEEISPDGGLPAVFLTVEGNTLKVMRVEFGQLFTSLTNNSHHLNNSSTSQSSKDKGKSSAGGPYVTSSSSPSIKEISVASANQQQLQQHDQQQFSVQNLPLVALQITQDVSRPFVVHFCTPHCCNSSPFSVSFTSRKVASKVIAVLGDASKLLREKTRKKFEDELKI